MVFEFNEDESSHVDPDAPGGKYGYRIGHRDEETGYAIPDRILNSVDDRNIRVLTIGAGMSGILMAHLIQRDCVNVTHTIYEKNGDIGGTWLENRYPGCACDVPSHAYTYAFALNADWPQYLSESDDIFRYLTRVVDCFELRKFMKFNSVVQNCEWNEDEGMWHVQTRNALTGETFSDTCHILLSANGLLNDWKFPEEVEGLNSFKGKLLHTARWPDDYGAEQWANERVAVLGSGASAIQTVPSMQPHVKHMDLFIRTAIWFVNLAGHSGINRDYPPEERRKYKEDTDSLVDMAKSIEGGINGIHGIKAMMTGSAEAKKAREQFANRMREHIPDDEIYKMLVPDFPFGCRRLTPGDPFMKAVQQNNVTLHKGAVTKVTPHTIIGADGTETAVDTIICATGFDVSYVPHYTMKGRNGVLLQDKWAKIPQGYMGLAVDEMPNYFVFQGPTFPVSNGSVLGPLQAVGAYVVQMIRKMQQEHVHSFDPKDDVTKAFNHHAQTWIVGTTWADRKCRAWYKDNKTGRVNSVWPGSSLHYAEMIQTPRYEDYNIKYSNEKNMFAFMGLGFTKNQAEEGDLSPYITKEAIEKKFYVHSPMPDEEDRIRERKHKVNDGPKAPAIKANGPLHTNGTEVNGASH